MTRKEIKARIKEIRKLEQNWDGEDAPPILKEVCDRAELIVDLLNGAKNMSIFPTSRGSINIEFSTDDTYFELEICHHATDGIVPLLCKRGDDGYFKDWTNNLNSIYRYEYEHVGHEYKLTKKEK